MKRQHIARMVTVSTSIFVVGITVAAQDKYTVKVPGGLAFSEFRGYEELAACVRQYGRRPACDDPRQSRDDRRLSGRRSRQRQAFSRRFQDGEDPLESEEIGDVPGGDGAGHSA